MNQPYVFTREDLNCIAQHFSNSHKDWTKKGLNRVKGRIKKYLLISQRKKCVYCKSKIRQGTTAIPIEHVVPKSKYSQFTFESKNLVLSCPMCNIQKGTKETLTDPLGTAYPTDKAGFLIINPYFDNYDDHLEIIDDIFICAKSTKGTKTIEICKLDRLELAIEKAEDQYINSANAHTKLILQLINTHDVTLQKRVNEILSVIDELIFEKAG